MNGMIEGGNLAAIEQAAEAGEDIFEMCVSAGQEAALSLDLGRYRIGDLALLVKKRYGANRIAEFAKQINVPVERVREYRTVCAFWQKGARAEILETYPNIFYSHLREAMRLGDLDKAVEFIEECSAKNWSVEQAHLEMDAKVGKPKPPLKLLDIETRITNVKGEQVAFVCGALTARTLADYANEGRQIRVVIYEVREVGNAAVSG